MITFICCSIKPEMAAALAKNIEDTVGVNHEFIAFDNREARLGICQVYNECAQKAKYDYLCFLHEDVQFNTPNLGEIIINKLSEPDCGVIGFAGSIFKPARPSGWVYSENTKREMLIQHRKGKSAKKVNINPLNECFSEVITLDGLCLFVRKNVWVEHNFDQDMLKEFHGYDIDFSLNVAQHFKNYVCCRVEVEHFSQGSNNEAWVESVKHIHNKWKNKLPMFTPEWINNIKFYDTPKAQYQFSRITMKQLYLLENPVSVGVRHFKDNWFHSHYAWLMLVKIVEDRLKGRK